MKILVGSTELVVTNCYPFRYNNGKLVLRIEVPQENIEHAALKTLLHGNTEDIVLTKDDGTQISYSGFTYSVEIKDKGELYYCEAECQSEAEYQISILKQKATTQDAIIAAQSKTITSLEEQTAGMEEVLILTDETAVELYEAQLEQEEINLAQDAALIEIYEMLGGN